MPFFDTTGVDTDQQRGPIWGVFATLRDQVERMVALNLVWSAQLLPALAALGYGDTWPMPLRMALVAYSAIALVPASALVYALVGLAAAGQHVGLEAARAALRSLAAPSMRALAPLYGLLGLLALAANAAGATATLAAVVTRLLLLLGLVCAAYWGPLLVQMPQQGPLALLRRSAGLALRFPALSLLAFGASLLAVLLAAISVGGLFLIAFVLVALVQTHAYQATQTGQQPAASPPCG